MCTAGCLAESTSKSSRLKSKCLVGEEAEEEEGEKEEKEEERGRRGRGPW